MQSRLTMLWGFVCALALATGLEARNVYMLPGDSLSGRVTVFSGDPFAQGSSLQVSTDVFQVLATPASNKIYILPRSISTPVYVSDPNLGSLRSLGNLAGQVTAAEMSPTGAFLAVAANGLWIIDPTSDGLVSLPIQYGTTDVAFSLDGSRLFALSPNTQTLTAIDAGTRSVVSSVSIATGANSVTAAPNGFLYVSASGTIQEIDGRNMTVRQNIPVQGATPGRLVYSPDGRYGVAVNLSGALGNSLVLVDLTTKAVVLGGNAGLLERLVVLSNNRAFAYSPGQQLLYSIGFSAGTINAQSYNVPGIGGIRGFATSNEAPASRYLYAAGSNAVARVDLFNEAQAPLVLAVPVTGGPLNYTGPAFTGSPANALTYNTTQFVAPLSQSAPVVVRVTDATGKPLYNVPVTFTPVSGVSLVTSPSVTTTAQGYAQAVVLAPSTVGTYQLTASIGQTGAFSTFTFNVGTGGGGGGGTPGVAGAPVIYSGNGQIARAGGPTPDPLRVLVKDAGGLPAYGVAVTWTISQGGGSLYSPLGCTSSSTCITYTDFQGQASVSFVADPLIGVVTSYTQSNVTATTQVGSATFVVTSIPLVTGQGQPVGPPTVQIVAPAMDATITGRAGTTVTAALQIRVTAPPIGTQAGLGIPNVAVKATTGLDATSGPTASCVTSTGGEPLTDQNGIATCDLLIGGKIGSAPLSVYGGGQQASSNITLVVTPGLPGQLKVIQGDAQSGSPGETLPLAMVVEVYDSFGNLLPGADVTWSVASGDVILQQSISRADNRGRASTLVRLGSTPGSAQVKVTAGTASVTFAVTIASTASSLTIVSGNNQSAIVNQPFGQPLVVQVVNPQGQALPGIGVSFAVTSGSAVLSAGSATTDANGRAQVGVTAGSAAGPVTISASSGSLAASFSLTVAPAGPRVDASGFVNAAGGAPGLAPCGIAVITGTGLASGLQGIVMANLIVGPLPTSLRNVSVQFGGRAAAIYNVSNLAGVESVTVQVPCELSAPSSVPVLIQAGGASTTVNSVSILRAAPGIFETADASGNRYGVATRPDGSYVSAANPARRGEIIRLYATGLGQTTPQLATGNAGVAGENVAANVVVGVNNAGVRVVSATAAFGMVGVYAVDFEVPSDTAAGSAAPLALAVTGTDGQLVFGNSSRIAIQ